MRSRMLIVTLTLLIGLLSVRFQCGKDSLFPVPENRFVEKMSLFPYKKTYQRGDTIWLQFQTTSKALVESLTNRILPTDTTFLLLNFVYEKRFPVPFNATVDTFCNTVTPQGLNQELTIPAGSRTENVLAAYSDCSLNYYSLKVGFIPRTTGIYSINRPGGQLVDCPNKIQPSTYSMINFQFDLADCNKDLYLSIPAAQRGESPAGQTEREIDNKKIFVFKVE